MFPEVWFHLNIVSKMSFRTFASICKYLKKSKGGVCSCGNKKKLSFKDSQFELYCEDFIICFFKRFREIFVCKDQGQKTALNALDFCTLRCLTHVSLLQWKHCMDSLPGNPQEHNHCEQTQFISASTGVNANLCHAEREKQINKVQTSCYRLWTWACLRKTQVKWKTSSRFNFVPNRGCCRVQTKDKNDHLQCYHCRMVRWHRGELTWSSCTFVISPLMLHSTYRLWLSILLPYRRVF